MTVIVSDKNQSYAEFIAEVVDEFSKHDIHAIAVVALVNDHYELTAYWNADLRDKLQVENAVRFDAFDTFLTANSGRYCEVSDE